MGLLQQTGSAALGAARLVGRGGRHALGLLSRALTAVKDFVTPERPAAGPDPRVHLAGAAPGQWSSNHLAEAAECKGWQFVAIRSLARMCSTAELAVHEVGTPDEKVRRTRRALKLASLFGEKAAVRYWQRRLKALKDDRRAARKAEATAAGGTHQEKRPVASSHPLLKLWQRPNPNQGLNVWLFAAAQQLALTGSCMAWRVKNQAGQPAELYILPTGLLQIRMPTPDYPHGSYWLTPLSAWGITSPQGDWAPGAPGSALLTGAVIDARDVRPIRWPHPLYLSDGLSPLSAIALWVDVANEMDRANWYLLHNASRPGQFFQWDSNLTKQPDPKDITRFREDLAAEYAGTSNTGKDLVLPPGMTAKPKTATAAEMDFNASGPRYRDMSLAAHAMSPIACGITEAGSYGAFWAAIKQTTELAVQPLLSLIASEMGHFLGSDFDGPATETTLTARAIDDPQLLEQRLRTDILAGNAVRVDEYRKMRGLPPLAGEEGMAFVGAKAVAGEGGDGTTGDADAAGGDGSTGTRETQRDAAPGRQDRNGKAHAQRKPARKAPHDVSDEARDEGGRFATSGSGGGGSDSATDAATSSVSDETAAARQAEDDDLADRRDAEDAEVAAKRDAEDEARQQRRDKEDARRERDQDRRDEKEQAALERKFDREDRQTGHAREREDDRYWEEHDARRAEIEAQTADDPAEQKRRLDAFDEQALRERAEIDRRREAEDDAREANRNEERAELGRRQAARREEEGARVQAERDAEDDALRAARDAEDEALQAARDAEDESGKGKAAAAALSNGWHPEN